MDLNFAFAFWNQEHGVNWQLIIAWGWVLFFTGSFLAGFAKKFSKLLLRLLNKIPFFKDTDIDEKVVEAIESTVITLVQARASDAKNIKTKYALQIQQALDAKDYAKVQELTKVMRDELEALTKGVVDDFQNNGDQFLWNLLIERYGDKAKAAKWLVQKIKAFVEAMRSNESVDIGKLVLQHITKAAEEAGNRL